MDTLLKPVKTLFNHLSIIQKFSLMFVLYLVPISYITYFVVSDHTEVIEQIQSEAEGLSIIHSLTPLIIASAKHRGLTNAFLNGNASSQAEIDSLKSQIDKHWQLAEQKLKHLNDTEITALFNQEKQSWLSLKSESTVTAAESFKQHSNIIAGLLKLISYIEESSKLFVDTNIENAYIISIYTRELPLLIENIGKARGIGTGILSKQKSTTKEILELSNFLNSIRNSIENINHYLKNIAQLEIAEKELITRFKSDNMVFLNLSNKNLLQTNSYDFDANKYFESGTATINNSITLLEVLYQLLNNNINFEENELNNEILLNFMSTLALLLGAIYFFIAFYSNIKTSIRQIHDVLGSLTEGNLTEEVKLESKDELLLIANDINKMTHSFRSLVSKVHESSDKVFLSSKENAVMSESTHENISQQNLEIEQVAQAINEMSSTVSDVALNAENTALATTDADTESTMGKEIVDKSIASIQSLSKELESSTETINDLQKHAQSIGSVLDVIQEIANQTNLLALNAAIEAARAGESGRGFAVVADEVRTLAGKTQESTEQIRKMIETLQLAANKATDSMKLGNEQSGITVSQANEAGVALIKISDSIDNISKMTEQIASAAVQQSSVAEEIKQNIINVKNLSDVTKNNAFESTTNSENLLVIAEELRSQVDTFKID